MAEIVNLRRARKAKARASDDAKAAENRAKFGRTRQERERVEAEAEIGLARLDGHKLRPDET